MVKREKQHTTPPCRILYDFFLYLYKKTMHTIFYFSKILLYYSSRSKRKNTMETLQRDIYRGKLPEFSLFACIHSMHNVKMLRVKYQDPLPISLQLKILTWGVESTWFIKWLTAVLTAWYKLLKSHRSNTTFWVSTKKNMGTSNHKAHWNQEALHRNHLQLKRKQVGLQLQATLLVHHTPHLLHQNLLRTSPSGHSQGCLWYRTWTGKHIFCHVLSQWHSFHSSTSGHGSASHSSWWAYSFSFPTSLRLWWAGGSWTHSPHLGSTWSDFHSLDQLTAPTETAIAGSDHHLKEINKTSLLPWNIYEKNRCWKNMPAYLNPSPPPRNLIA